MSRIESLLLSYLFNSLWLVPLAFAGSALAARMLRAAGTRVQHCAWVGGLIAASLLPVLSMLPVDRFNLGWIFARAGHSAARGEVTIEVGPGSGIGGAWFPPIVLHLLAIAYCGLLAYLAFRFVWRCVRVASLARESTPLLLDGEQAQSCREWSARLGTGPVELAESGRVFAPVALGVRRKMVLLPAELDGRLAPADFDMVIAHEFAHIQRNDFVKNLCFEILALPVSYHPMLWLTRQRVMESRENVCDETAARVCGNSAYIQSLLRLASLLVHGFARPLPHGIGVFDADALERRLMKLTQNLPPIGHARRVALVVLSLALAAGAGASALALHLSLDPAAVAADSSSNPPSPKTIPSEVLVRNVITKVPPVYPPDAKKAHIKGTVVLNVIIGKSGDVENLKVASGPQELQQSALDAVRQWKYKPFLANGEPIEVESTVNIIYSLGK
jgi:TonB family protein